MPYTAAVGSAGTRDGRSRAGKWAKRLAPYCIAAVALAAVFSRYSPRRIAAEVEHGRVLPLVPIAFVLLVSSLLLVALADTVVMRKCTGGPRFLDVLFGKAGTSLLGAIGYAAGQGGYGVWIARKTGSSVGLAGGIVLYIISSDLVSVAVVASVAVWIGGAQAPGYVGVVAPVVALVLVGLKVIGPLRLLRRYRRPVVLEPWRRVNAGWGLVQIAIRVLQIYVLVVGTWIGARVFGLGLPLWVMAVYLPIVLVIGSMPVNVAGFGAVQGAWLLMAPWSTAERVLAFSLVWQLAIILAGVARGLPFVKRVVADIAAGSSSAAPAATRGETPPTA